MIKIHNLEKSFGNNHVLNGVNIEITRGECVVSLDLLVLENLHF